MPLSSQFVRSVTLLDSARKRKEYPFSLPAVQALGRTGKLTFDPRVTFLVGENGSGKSTLLEALAISLGFNAEGGTRNLKFSTSDSHSCLHEHLRVTRGIRIPKSSFFLRAESFYNVATAVQNQGLEELGWGDLHARSHGESFLETMQNKFRAPGLFLMDEPEAALSPTRQMGLLALMHQLVGESSQFVIATHSPIIMAYPDALIYELTDHGIKRTAYEDSTNYVVTREFLNRPDVMLRELLS